MAIGDTASERVSGKTDTEKCFGKIDGNEKNFSLCLDSHCVDGKFPSKIALMGETTVFDFQNKGQNMEVIS